MCSHCCLPVSSCRAAASQVSDKIYVAPCHYYYHAIILVICISSRWLPLARLRWRPFELFAISVFTLTLAWWSKYTSLKLYWIATLFRNKFDASRLQKCDSHCFLHWLQSVLPATAQLWLCSWSTQLGSTTTSLRYSVTFIGYESRNELRTVWRWLLSAVSTALHHRTFVPSWGVKSCGRCRF